MPFARHCFLPAFLCPSLVLAAPQPYTPDANTVILYHCNETSGSTVTDAAGNYQGVYSTGTGSPAAPKEVASSTGFTGFGTAFANGVNDGVGVDFDSSGTWNFDDVEPGDRFDMSLLGTEFTLEALVNLPSLTAGNMHLWGGDGNAGRAFQFRITNGGVLTFDPTPGGTNLTFDLTSVVGPHAFAANEWFHVAMTYSNPTGPNNTVVNFYWTRLDSGATSANLVLTGALNFDSSVDAPLVFGNEGRSTGGLGEGLIGLLDEGRVSNVARAADEFVFNNAIFDTDNDGLPDAWETANSLDPEDDGSVISENGASGDPDNDTFDNLAEYQAGSNPRDPASTPLDSDADGLPDDWERSHFNSLVQSPSGDFDNDGDSNLTEFTNGTDPADSGSNSFDTDRDHLPDAWEMANFGSLDHNGGSDPDGDGFGNLQEYEADTLPADATSRPAGVAARLVPIDDGDPTTSEFGYGGNSAINAVAFVRSALQTFGDQQFIAYYGRHESDAAAAFNNTMWIGRRTIGSSEWEVFRHPTFTANTITDGHDVICFGIDGDGYMHLSWGMHGDAFHYSRSSSPVTGSDPIELGPDTTMTGNENAITYPQFLRLPDGDLLYLYREGASGSGDTYLNRYRTASQTWENVHTGAGGSQQPFIKGRGWSPDYNAYPNMPQLDADGNFTLTWCWRYNGDSPAGEAGYQTNNNFAFARSTDGGVTWNRFDGTPYTLPISRDGESGNANTAAEHIFTIPEGSSLINQASMALDSAGNPVICSWWAPGTQSGDHRRQYMIGYRAGDGSWQLRQVSNRSNNSAGTKYSESAVRDLGRPIVVTDDEDRIIVAYRDDDGASNGLTIVHSLPKAVDPDRTVWIEFDLTTENLGNYEAVIDWDIWKTKRQLHFLHQPSEGKGYTTPANLASRVSVLEWDAAAYFSHRLEPTFELVNGGSDARFTLPSGPSWSYRLWTSLNLEAWQEVETKAGDGGLLELVHVGGGGDERRFWRIECREGGF